MLRSHGIEPRRRILLVGPPGNGKKSLAEALARETELPFFPVRCEAAVTSCLGETAQRLKRLFDCVRTLPCVLFLDEFDAIGKERGDERETGEIKRLVTSPLLQIDELPTYCVSVAAANHQELLDRASWRRFEIRLSIGKPTRKAMRKHVRDKLAALGVKSGAPAEAVLDGLKPESCSQAESFFHHIRRRQVLNPVECSLDKLIK